MTKAAFDKIATGLAEALDHVVNCDETEWANMQPVGKEFGAMPREKQVELMTDAEARIDETIRKALEAYKSPGVGEHTVIYRNIPLSPRATLIEAMQDAENPTDALDRMLAAMAALGLKVVPVEATREMVLSAADRQYDCSRQMLYIGVYAACIAAAPDVLGAGE